MRVSESIGDQGRQKAGGIFQDKTYGRDMRVCNSCGPADSPKWMDTVTGQIVSDTKKK